MSVRRGIVALVVERFLVSVSYELAGDNDTGRVRVIDLSEGDEYVQEVADLRPFVVKAGYRLRFAWAATDDYDIIYLVDPGDDNFCYAVNLQVPDFSEWGYCPVP